MLNPKKTRRQRQHLRNNMTKWEARLWQDLKGKKMYGYKIRRQYGVYNYILDFYCPALKLAIEIDGDYHFDRKRIQRDKEKDARLAELNIRVIRLTTVDFEEDYESVVIYLENEFLKRSDEIRNQVSGQI